MGIRLRRLIVACSLLCASVVTAQTYPPPYVEWTAPLPCTLPTDCPPLADQYRIYRNGTIVGTLQVVFGQQGILQWPLTPPLNNGEVIGVGAYNSGNMVESIIPSVTVGGQAPPITCLLSEFKAEYFNNMTLSGTPIVTRCEMPPLDYNWGSTTAPVAGLPTDKYSIRWSGTFVFLAGKTTFSVSSDDGVRLRLGTDLLIDQWHDQAITTYTAVRTTTAQNYPVTVEYYENASNAALRASWKTELSPQPPALMLTCSPNITSTTSIVTYPAPVASGGTPPYSSSCAPASGSEFPPGDTPVTCNATDSLGVTASCGFTVTTPLPPPPPLTMTCPANIDSPTHDVVYPNPTVTGGVPPVTFSCAPPSGSIFPGGTSTVSCSGIDSAGTAAACSFMVTTPIDPPQLDTEPPAVQITRIRRQGNSANYRITVDAKDNVEVLQVTFKVDGVTQAVLTLPPFEASVRIPGSGTHTILVEAIDQAKNLGSAQATLSR